jgi:16S rRNA (cytosine1407-C5)-methyltransferase
MNEEFDEYYRKIYGGRWRSLRTALLAPYVTVGYEENLTAPYHLDYASVIAASSLRLGEEGTVLDACAAPGGKTLVLASRIKTNPNLRLLSNEISNERRRRLVNVVNTHTDAELRSRITVSGFDAAAAAAKKNERDRFCAVLLDAPCSSERHVIQNEKALSEWKPARPRFLANRQWALLSAAFLLLRENGSLVYSTCAITNEENDDVAARLLKKYKGMVEIDSLDCSPPQGEPTKFGRIFLPDAANNLGPMYIARFVKRG